MHGHRVGPVELGKLRIADRQVAGEAIVEAIEREGAAGGDEPSLAVLALLVDGGEYRHTGKEQAFLLGLVDRFAGRSAVGRPGSVPSESN